MNKKLEFILIIYCIGSGKFCLEFITSVVTPVFPSVILKWQNLSFNDSFNNSKLDKFDYGKLSILYGTKNIFQVMLSIAIGFIVDHVGDLETLLVGMILEGVSVILYGTAPTYYVLLIGRIFEGISSTTIQCSVSAYIAYKFSSQSNRCKWFGYVSLCMYIAGSVAPLYGGFVYQFHSRLLTFLLILIPISVHLCLVIILLIDKKNKKAKEIQVVVNNNNIETLMNSYEIKDTSMITGSIKSKLRKKNSLLGFFLDPFFLIAMISYPVVFMSYYILYATLPRYMKIKFGVDEYQQGLIWSLTIVGYVIGFIFGNILNNKLQTNRHYVLIAILFANSFFSLIINAMPVWWAIAFPVCFVFTHFLLFDMFCSPILSKITELKHDKQYGKMAGLLLTGTSMTSSIWSISSPLLFKKIGLLKLTIIIYCVNILYIPFIYFLKDFSVK